MLSGVVFLCEHCRCHDARNTRLAVTAVFAGRPKLARLAILAVFAGGSRFAILFIAANV